GHLLIADIKRYIGIAWQQFTDGHATRCRVVDLRYWFAFGIDRLKAPLDLAVQRDNFVFKRMLQLAHIGKYHALARLFLCHDGQIIEAENHVLRRNDDRCAVGRMQDVVGRHHQHARFKLGFKRQRNVNSHLVTVEVSVKRRTNERMKLNSLAFNQGRLKSLNTKTVQRRSAVQKNRMLADHFIKNIPDFRAFLFNQLLRLLNSRREALGVKTCIDERLEQFECHLIRQAALVQLEFWTGHDNRTTGIIDTLAKQVLAEAPLLAFQHGRQRLQRTLVGAGDDAATTAVIEQRGNGFLQQALFIADDDAGRAQFHQALQTVVTVDDATIKIIELRRRKPTAIQPHKRT